MRNPALTTLVLSLAAFAIAAPVASNEVSDVARLVAAIRGKTPIISDLQNLTNSIGGRPTGSEANAKAVVWGFANDDDRLPRQSRAEVEALVRDTSLAEQLKGMNFWADWRSGRRGREED